MIKLKFSVQQIKATAQEGPLSFKEKVDASELANIPSLDIREIGMVDVEGFCTIEKNDIIFSFTIEGEMILPCARTLVDVNYPFKFQATEIFTTDKRVADEEEDIHFIEDDFIDLTPYIFENIVVQMPYRVFSDEKMIEEGEGWSFYTEDEFDEMKKQKIDPRLEKLQQFFNNKK